MGPLPWAALDWLVLARTAALAFGYLPARGIALPSGLGWLRSVVRTGVTPAALLAVTVILVLLLWPAGPAGGPGRPAAPGLMRVRPRAAPAGKMRAMPVRYAYLGPEGTFTEAALAEFDPSAPAEAMPCASIPAALDAVRGGAAERAIVPIESSVEGAVTATLDELAAGPDLAIQAELLLPVTFALLGREGTGLADIKTVGGHPQAQPQCRRWLAQHLPDAEWLPTSSNAEAARQAADGQIDAALAGVFAAGRYGLAVLAAEVNDVPDAVTRFVVVSRLARCPPPPARTGPRWWPSCARTTPAR